MENLIADFPGGRYAFSLIVGFMIGAVLVHAGLVDRALRKACVQMPPARGRTLRVLALGVFILAAFGVSLALGGLVLFGEPSADRVQVGLMAIGLNVTFVGFARLLANDEVTGK